MFGLDLLCRGDAPKFGKIRHIRRIVHLADLLDLVGGEFDAELALQPILLKDTL